MAEESDLEKTESASPRRLEQAREEGNVPQSRELQTFLVLILGVGSLWLTSQWMVSHVVHAVRDGLVLERRDALDPAAMLHALGNLSSDGLLAIAPMMVVLMIAAVAGPLSLGGFNLSTKAISPDFGRINPLQGIKRVFSMHGLAELIKGVLKTLVIGSVSAWVIWRNHDDLMGLMSMPLDAGLARTGKVILTAALLLASSLGLLALLDVPFQLWRYYEQLKMTKEEVKQESKEQEGNPQIKGRIRARQREMARRRMMDAVPKADVVVTNPTHYAVALKYEAGKMGAPTVVAKGADLVAANIRKLAQENKVPLLEAPPLARALFRHTEIGEQIPAALYTAVAEVMAYVYQLNEFIARGGLPPETPHDLPVPADMDPHAATP
ncbi:flagellar biosynthesis protein FlhB [Uliginosibacterium sp. sgz301328]|uniref:flagellar biosynthesis protein FlhB n=1 Tax=Uliginosibacterium sp. sgz301328 TaxID=3243764 RepID=UPI00359CFD65